MAIVNRTMDSSEQRKVLENLAGPTGTGATVIIGQVPWPCIVDAAQFAAFGLSGAPTAQLVVNRFIVGQGFTAFNLGSANVLPAFGTSGVLAVGASLPAAGSTLNTLQTNDVILVQTGGANSAVTGLSVGIVLRPIQDVKKAFGLV